MYALFRSVTAKNGKMLTPARTENFLLTSMDAEFYAMDWPGGNGLCKIQGTLIEISYTASILTLVAISHERSRSVRSTSLARNRSVAQRTIVIKILWIVAIVVCAPLFYGYATEEENGKQLCPNTKWRDNGRQTYYMLQAVLIFVCTLIYIIWVHWKILRVLQTHISLLWKVSCSIPKCNLKFLSRLLSFTCKLWYYKVAVY